MTPGLRIAMARERRMLQQRVTHVRAMMRRRRERSGARDGAAPPRATANRFGGDDVHRRAGGRGEAPS